MYTRWRETNSDRFEKLGLEINVYISIRPSLFLKEKKKKRRRKGIEGLNRFFFLQNKKNQPANICIKWQRISLSQVAYYSYILMSSDEQNDQINKGTLKKKNTIKLAIS